MTLLVIAALGIGVGATLMVAGIVPQRLTLNAALAQLAPRRGNRQAREGSRSARAHQFAGKGLTSLASRYPRFGQAVVSDLAITGKQTDAFAMRCVAYGVAFGMGEVLIDQAMAFAGLSISAGTELFLLVASVVFGAISPFFDLKSEAAKRRLHFAHILGIYVSMVTMLMASSMGWSSALEAATSVSPDEWVMGELRAALIWSQTNGYSPWRGFARLSEFYRVPELATVARSLEQASDGASIRESLDSISKAMREKQAIEAENAAQATTQRMLLPGVLVMLGYCVLVFYPAMSQFVSARF